MCFRPEQAQRGVLHHPKIGERLRNKKRSHLSQCKWRERYVFAVHPMKSSDFNDWL